MNDYFQPSFYKFSEDSVALVNFVSSQISKVSTILDLGAGSGIIGIELSNILMPKSLCLVEGQIDWEPYIINNINQKLDFNINVDIHFKTFGDWLPTIKYDLIVANPPYFLEGHGLPSKDIRRFICRTFILDGWNILLHKIFVSLNSNGTAYLVIRRNKKLKEIVENEAEKLFLIRNYDHHHLTFVELKRLDID